MLMLTFLPRVGDEHGLNVLNFACVYLLRLHHMDIYGDLVLLTTAQACSCEYTWQHFFNIFSMFL